MVRGEIARGGGGGRNDPFVLHAAAKTVPPRRGTSPEGAEGVSRPRCHSARETNGHYGRRKVNGEIFQPLVCRVGFAIPRNGISGFSIRKKIPLACICHCLLRVSPFGPQGFGNPHLRLRRISNPSQQIGFSRQIGFFRPLVIPNPPQRNSHCLLSCKPFRACGFGNPHLRLRRISNPPQRKPFPHYISIAPNYPFLFAPARAVAATTHIPAS